MLRLSSQSPRVTVVLCLLVVKCVSGVAVMEMFPFGPEVGDVDLLQGRHAWKRITLQRPVTTFGTPTNHVEIHSNGWIELVQKNGSSLSTAGVLVFPPEMTTDTIGHVFYRETTDPDLLSSTGKALGQLFPGFGNPIAMVVITYSSYFKIYCENEQPLIQFVLGTDGASSFAMLLYAEKLKWCIPPSQDTNGGLPATIGFFTTTGFRSIFIPWPGYPYGDVMNAITTGNTGVPGFWGFQINDKSVKIPLTDECELGIDTCDPNAECVDLTEGFNCVCNLGFAGDGVLCLNAVCLTRSSKDRFRDGRSLQLSSSEQNCGLASYVSCLSLYCIGEKVDDRRSVSDGSGSGSATSDGVTVGFVLVDLSVQEGDGTVAGCMEIKNAESVILEQPIEVTMSSFSCGLALEETDYVPGGISQQFSMSNQGQQLCLSVTIINDNTPEANETFCMRLTSRHPAVILDPANAIVTIYDDDDSEGTSPYQGSTLAPQTLVSMKQTSTLVLSSLTSELASTVSSELVVPTPTITTVYGRLSSLTSPARTNFLVHSSELVSTVPLHPTMLTPTQTQFGLLSAFSSLKATTAESVSPSNPFPVSISAMTVSRSTSMTQTFPGSTSLFMETFTAISLFRNTSTTTASSVLLPRSLAQSHTTIVPAGMTPLNARNNGDSNNLPVVIGVAGGMTLFSAAVVILVITVTVFMVKRKRRKSPVLWVDPAGAEVYMVSNLTTSQRTANRENPRIYCCPTDTPIFQMQSRGTRANPVSLTCLQESGASGATSNDGEDTGKCSDEQDIDMEASHNGRASVHTYVSQTDIANALTLPQTYETVFCNPDAMPSAENKNVSVASSESSNSYEDPDLYLRRQVDHDREPDIPTTQNISYHNIQLLGRGSVPP